MKYFPALLAMAAATPALADSYCDDLWFTRNAIMDRAGYCFGSSLGKHVFDNGDCIGTSVTLSEADATRVAKLEAQEREAGCRVDTSRSRLDVLDLRYRQRLVDLPVTDGLESTCIGWRGDPLPLRAGHGLNTDVIGQVLPGDTLNYGHYPVGGWSYVTVHDSDWHLKSAGWYHVEAYPQRCAQFAG